MSRQRPAEHRSGDKTYSKTYPPSTIVGYADPLNSLHSNGLSPSGRQDSNLRPPEPHASGIQTVLHHDAYVIVLQRLGFCADVNVMRASVHDSSEPLLGTEPERTRRGAAGARTWTPGAPPRVLGSNLATGLRRRMAVQSTTPSIRLLRTVAGPSPCWGLCRAPDHSGGQTSRPRVSIERRLTARSPEKSLRLRSSSRVTSTRRR